MEKVKCEICGKEIEGYGLNHAKFLLKQHQLTHDPDTQDIIRSIKNKEEQKNGKEDDKIVQKD